MSDTEDKYDIPFYCSKCNKKQAVLFIFEKPICSGCMALSISTVDIDPEINQLVDKHFWELA